MSKVNRTVKLTETDLVNLIDNVVTEAIEVKKKEWLAEQVKAGDKNAILEQRLAKLEAKISAKK